MTCVAFDGQSLAADSLSTMNYGFAGVAQKLWVLPGRSHGINVIGGAGDYGHVVRAARFLALAGMHPAQVDLANVPGFKSDDVSLLWVHQATRRSVPEIWVTDGGVFTPRTKWPFFAIGNGCDFATTAMYLGRSAEQGVRTACNFLSNCGGDVQVIHLKDVWDEA